MGAALSLLFSGLALIGTRQEGSFSWGAFCLSAIFSAGFSALMLGSVGGLTHFLVGLSRSLRGRALGLSATLSTLFALIYALLRGGSELFRISSGAPFEIGTWEFLTSGLSHLMWPLAVEYGRVTFLLVILAAAFTYATHTFLSRPVLHRIHSRALLLRGSLSLGGLALLFNLVTTTRMARGAGLELTSDLAFFSSLSIRREVSRQLEEGGKEVSQIDAGPLLSSEHLWQGALKASEGPRPNVVLILLESVGLSHLGYEGYERPVTPHLDALAALSVRFRNARSTAAHSNYAQMAVLSSLFPRRYPGLDVYRRLDYPRYLWHDFLSELGYRTATFSSQDESWQGMLRFQQTGTKTTYHHSGNFEGSKIRMGSELVVPDEITASRAIEWMDQQQGRFGLYLNFQSTHFPYRTPAGRPAKFGPTALTKGKYHYLHYPKTDRAAVINRYDNALLYVDEQIGRVLGYLERTDRAKNTIVIVTSDHGELFWDHGMVTHGRSLAEEEVRVPLLIRFPGHLVARDEEHPVSTLDVLPLLADLLDVPPHPSFQGLSVLEPEESERGGAERAIFMNIQGMKSKEAVVCGAEKLIHDRGTGKRTLYDLAQDPGEQHDLFRGRRVRAEALSDLLSAQVKAQLRYHDPADRAERARRFAPRLAGCPEVQPEAVEVQAPRTAAL